MSVLVGHILPVEEMRSAFSILRPRLLPRASSAAVAVLLLLIAVSSSEAVGLRHFTCMVPMRDGTRLATDVYLPRLPRGPYPVLLVRTPYGKHEITRLMARWVCHHGVALVVQDTRGRFCSEGVGAMVFLDDGWGANRDGHDTLQWIARQSWCDGNVGMWGVSALGVMANLAAPDAPQVLKAQHVTMAFSDMYSQAVYQGGVLRKSLVEGWLRENRFPASALEKALAHPTYDDFWASLDCEAQAARVNAPAVFWGGWYDVFLQGTINSFVTIHNHGGPKARGNCRLIIGPWAHSDARWLVDPRKARGVPQAADPLRFFNYWLKGCPNSVPCDKAVHYYVMGDRCDPHAPGNFWRTADNWPPPTEPVKFYLHADGSLKNLPPQSSDARLSYRYDPNDPVPTIGGQNLHGTFGPLDQRPVESRSDVLLFTSQPLLEPLEVTGRIYAELYVSSDCPDTDFTVKLTDVYPDGRSIILCDGILRARYHESFQRPDLLTPGKVYKLRIDLWSTSVVFNRGHRIRVAVSSSNYPRFEPNPNTGKLPRESDETRVATNTVHLSAQWPSHIILPVDGRQGRR